MKLYNTRTRTIKDIQPQTAGKVSVYTCGPTVYDYAHIGHWFNYVRMDLLIRALKADGLEPTWVMNITDVGHLVSDADEGEDKLEKGARREGKTAWEVAEYYTEDFLDCMAMLDITQPNYITKATDHIKEQIALIQTLEQKGYTYVIDDGVYYDTSKFANYAAFAQLDLSEQQAGARVQVNSQKRNASDFALWKFSPSDHQRDMEWDSPWGRGFPGWHIECSAMSMKYLGSTLDIHTGGIDHIPVHHTNEIAQSEAATGQRFANYWMHSNHVTVNGEKISKSLGNGIRLQELFAKGYDNAAVRISILESHYRTQAKFSWDSLEAARNRLQHWQEVADLYWQPVEGDAEAFTLAIHTASLSLRGALANDLDTPAALAAIDALLAGVQATGVPHDAAQNFKEYLQLVYSMLGIYLLGEGDISEDQNQLLVQRAKARARKDWVQSDTLRDSLATQGIGVRDSADGAQTWYRLP